MSRTASGMPRTASGMPRTARGDVPDGEGDVPDGEGGCPGRANLSRTGGLSRTARDCPKRPVVLRAGAACPPWFAQVSSSPVTRFFFRVRFGRESWRSSALAR
jgi:hypothetical protein